LLLPKQSVSCNTKHNTQVAPKCRLNLSNGDQSNDCSLYRLGLPYVVYRHRDVAVNRPPTHITVVIMSAAAVVVVVVVVVAVIQVNSIHINFVLFIHVIYSKQTRLITDKY
jgi:hypothetical protein